MVYTFLILGICFPFILPFVRQIVKKYPTTFPHLIYNVFNRKLWKKRDIIFIVLGILVSFLWIHSLYHFNLAFNLIAPFTAIFLISLLFISLADWYKRIIPDFITFPILILGLLLPHFTIFTPLTPFDAILGACLGYFIPSLLALLTERFRPNGIGAGDIKLLAMVGAWVGPIGLSYAIVGATILFSLYSIYTKKRTGPLAPFVGISTLAILFFL